MDSGTPFREDSRFKYLPFGRIPIFAASLEGGTGFLAKARATFKTTYKSLQRQVFNLQSFSSSVKSLIEYLSKQSLNHSSPLFDK